MSLDAFRKGHGNGRGSPRVETPLEEVVPVQAPEHALARRDRDVHGRWLAGAKHDQHKGGLAKRDLSVAMLEAGLAPLLQSPDLAPLADEIRTFIRAQRMRIAERIGGGECGPGPTKAIVSAAVLDAKGKAELARGNLAGSKLLVDSVQVLSKAYVMAAHEAKHAPRLPYDLGAALADGAEPTR